MIDPVMADLSRYLDHEDVLEGIDRYAEENEGRHICQDCSEDCKRCKIYKHGLKGRGENEMD